MSVIDYTGIHSLGGLLDERTEAHPNKEFLVFEDKLGNVSSYTYRQFTLRVNQAATALSKHGIARGSHVVFHLTNCPEFVLLWFALAKLGAVTIPSNTSNTVSEIAYILDYADAIAIVTESIFLPVAQQALLTSDHVRHLLLARTATRAENAILLDEFVEAEDEEIVPNVSIAPTENVEILFTSGTTARPKGVVFTHANCLRGAERTARSLQWTQDERCLIAFPLFHVGAQCLALLPTLFVGGTSVLLERFSASRFWEQTQRHKITQTALVGMAGRTLLAQPLSAYDTAHSVRQVFYTIGVSNEERQAFERRFHVETVNGYGMTETMAICTVSPLFGSKQFPSCGFPTQDLEVQVVDEQGQRIPSGAIGEIVIRGNIEHAIMKEYYKDVEGTNTAFRDGWFHTGDNGYFDEHGYLYFFDRKKDMIKRAGENVSTAEVESILLCHPSIVEAAVIGIPDPMRDESIKTFVVLTEPNALSEEDIQVYCANHLARFKVPTSIEIRDSLPKLSSGKIQKSALKQTTFLSPQF